ncbi:MAG: methyltransferase domain-containing protein [Clostridia bacterium]|nr:methyltransferase domain-containing protein [Clostridia bacterium]
MGEFRKIFDTIPEQFDCYRPRYSEALFADLIACAHIGKDTSVLELGPGTGQATEPILRTGCDYHAIELGENLAGVMRRKYGHLPNFSIVVDDFITHDFQGQQFDLIYSAATIQWIPEGIAFPKVFDLLKPGGTLAMMLTRGDYKTPNEALFNEIQKVYAAHFRPMEEYRRGYRYRDCLQYGFAEFEQREYHGRREFTADQYVAFSGTHCDHLVIEPEHREPFFDGLRKAVLDAGNKIVFHDTFVLMTVKKPQ